MIRRPNIPTALTEREADALHGMAKGRVVVEIGSLLGFSTVVMAKSAKVVYAIDPHEGYPAGDPRPTYETFIRNLHRYDVRDRVVSVRRRVQDVPFAAKFAELAFIDASGRFEDTLDSILACDDWLELGAPLCVHDYGLSKWPGAKQAVDAWSRIKERPFTLVDTMAVFR